MVGQVAQVSFVEGELNLIHIPLELYSTFLQPILRVLLPQTESLTASLPEGPPEGLTVDNKHGFLNVSITPVECSVVCHTYWAKKVFDPVIKSLPKDAAKTVSISKDSYIALCVISAGMDAGSRVVDLSSPLALAGIPIFFITTYYSDFILVPLKDRKSVVQALYSRGFEFSAVDSSYVSPASLSHHSRGGSMASEPSTPPPTNAAELQVRTFELLRKRSVVPHIAPDLHLIYCSGREESHVNAEFAAAQRPSASRGHHHGGSSGGSGNGAERRPSWVDGVDSKLYTCLVSALALPPRFLSITLAQEDAPSLLLDKTLLPFFGDSLVGNRESDLVPIFLDLLNLPFEATGIVSGVAGKLVAEMHLAETPELSYLSTSKAGAVILACEHSQKALDILLPLLKKT